MANQYDAIRAIRLKIEIGITDRNCIPLQSRMLEEDNFVIEVENTPPPTKEDCMEKGVCFNCSPLFEIPLVDGLCALCDEDKHLRKKLNVPDDACWWEERNGQLICGTSSMCPCRSYFEMELFKKMEWNLIYWPGGTCSQKIRDTYEKARHVKAVKHSQERQNTGTLSLSLMSVKTM